MCKSILELQHHGPSHRLHDILAQTAKLDSQMITWTSTGAEVVSSHPRAAACLLVLCGRCTAAVVNPAMQKDVKGGQEPDVLQCLRDGASALQKGLGS